MMKRAVQLRTEWLSPLKEQFESEYMDRLRHFLLSEKKAGREIYPPSGEWFAALNATPPDEVKVVILGQDPYHGIGQANGLCFSVSNGTKIPPSLRNIFKELQKDLQIQISKTGNLEKWASQGILLLNTTLTVREKEPASHQNIGCEEFTNTIISKLSLKKDNLIFILWGNFAQKKTTLINDKKHYILKAKHPSPLSAYRGFLGCKHFSKINKILIKNNKPAIKWDL